MSNTLKATIIIDDPMPGGIPPELGEWMRRVEEKLEALTRRQIEPHLIDSRDAAALLGISESHLRRLVGLGEIPVIKIGSSIRFRRAGLENWAAEREETAAEVTAK